MSPGYGDYGGYDGYGFRPYVPVGVRRARAKRALPKLLGKGKTAAPVLGQGKQIAASFWGRAWCRNLERYSDYASRLPRGRTYVRNGSVVHLDVLPGAVLAYVSGSELYTVKVKIAPVSAARWRSLCADCVGSIGSLVELLKGELDAQVMERVCQVETGLFPSPTEIELSCSCPDWADMCKHVAAVLYGIGVRLDDDPDVLFRLRKVSAAELVADAAKGLTLPKRGPSRAKVLAQDQVAGVFGVDLGAGTSPAVAPVASQALHGRSKQAAAPRKPAPTSKPARRLPKPKRRRGAGSGA